MPQPMQTSIICQPPTNANLYSFKPSADDQTVTISKGQAKLAKKNIFLTVQQLALV
jgi:hypothetical protein